MIKIIKLFRKGNIIDKIFMIIAPVIIILGIIEIIKVNIEPTNIIVKAKVEIEEEKENKEYEIQEEIANNLEKETVYFYRSIKGRGRSDSGRAEPNYVGLYGYASIYDGVKLGYEHFNTPWNISTYRKIDYDHYEVNGTLEHKTIVKVLSQELEHRGYGAYDGYLTVSIPDNEEVTYIIDVSNFITNDYWNFTSVLKSTGYGYSIAEYHQVSDKLPVNINNEISTIEEGELVIIVGKTDQYPGDRVDDKLRQIETKYYGTNEGEYRIFFNEDDLKIIY